MASLIYPVISLVRLSSSSPPGGFISLIRSSCVNLASLRFLNSFIILLYCSSSSSSSSGVALMISSLTSSLIVSSCLTSRYRNFLLHGRQMTPRRSLVGLSLGNGRVLNRQDAQFTVPQNWLDLCQRQLTLTNSSSWLMACCSRRRCLQLLAPLWPPLDPCRSGSPIQRLRHPHHIRRRYRLYKVNQIFAGIIPLTLISLTRLDILI